jgi:hypothetical protein
MHAGILQPVQAMTPMRAISRFVMNPARVC